MILGVIAAILIVVAGARLVTSGGNSSAMEAAKSSMSNLVIGYIIVLSAWLVMDYGLRALLVEGTAAQFGMWNQISCVDQPVSNTVEVVQQEVVYIPIDGSLGTLPGWTFVGGGNPGGSGGGGSDSGMGGGGTQGAYTAPCTVITAGPSGQSAYSCVTQQTQCTQAGGIPSVNAARNAVTCNPGQVVTGGGGTGGSLPQCTNSFCSVSALMRAGMTSREANVMSCIAMTESSGNPNIGPYNERNPGSNSSACGLFQIVRTTWNANNPGGNCSNHADSCRNAYCNTQVAVRLVRSNGFSDWTCANCNSKASQCIQRYGG
jgi:hypothetical protein